MAESDRYTKSTQDEVPLELLPNDDQPALSAVDTDERADASIEYMFESSHRIVERNVLPDSDYIPAGKNECFIRCVVTLDGSEQLRIPVAGVDRGVSAMIRA